MLSFRKQVAKTVILKIRFENFRTMTRANTMPDYIVSAEEIRKAAFSCLKRIDLNSRVRLIGIRVTDLEKVEKVSLPG
jgi:DNA polymerase IV